MEKVTAEQIKNFQNQILNWYKLHERDLPWRKTRDPYKILVSEVMLQQTQVNRVIPKFEAWLKTFPTANELAKAPVSEVLEMWSGLGYNRRALNLKKAAQVIVDNHKGKFPQTEKELLALPGIGNYTARAILCFAFNQQVAVVDTNVRKVILVHFFPERIRQPAEEPKGIQISDSLRLRSGNNKVDDQSINTLAEQLLPHGHAYEWNQALMDYASSVLKKEKIPIPKQSTFIGSHRYYRGQILKVLLANKSVAINQLGPMIKKDYSEAEKPWLKELIDELVHEGFVEFKKNTVELAS